MTSQNPGSMAKVQLPLVQPVRPQLFDTLHLNCAPFSESPARDVLRHLPEGLSAAAVLLLGCTDASCLLTSLAARHPGLGKLLAVLGEPNALKLARTALLLLLIAELDPDSQDDMQVLWEVWYCAAWSPATLPRIKPFIERLQNSSVPWLTAVRPEDNDILHYVWSSWLAKDKPSVTKAMKSRQEWKRVTNTFKGLASGYDHLINDAVHQVVKLDSLGDLEDALQDTCDRQEAGLGKAHLAQKVLQQDMKTYLETECLAPNYSGQEAIRPRSINVTLLRPSNNDWCGWLYCSPALCWGPFGAAELVAAVRAGSHAGLLARVCIAHIAQLVRKFQANTQLGAQSAAALQGEGSCSRVQFQVQLVCVSALQLCLGMSLSGTEAAASPDASTHQQKSEAPAAAVSSCSVPLLFDAIGSSELAVEVGLLPVLVAAGARLKPAWHARLYIGLRGWGGKDCTLDHFIYKQSLCMPPSLTPTLLGLRLLTDLEADAPETAEEQEYTYRVDNFRELVWAPVPRELRTSPQPKLSAQLLGGPASSIEACLLAVATQLCCGTLALDDAGEQNPERGTPQLLAWLLASLIERTDMSALLEGSGSDSRGYKSNKLAASIHVGTLESQQPTAATDDARHKYQHTQRVLWALRTKVAQFLPHQSQLCFITGIDVLRSSLQQHAPKAWWPADVPPCPGVKQLVVPLQHRSQRLNLRHMFGMRPVLVEQKGAQQLAQQRPANSEDLFRAMPVGMHILDIWASDTWGQIQRLKPTQAMITFYMPTDFTLPPGQCLVSFEPNGHVTKTARSMLQGMVLAPGILAQLLLPSTCPSTGNATSTSTALPQVSSPAGQACDTAGYQQEAAAYKLQVVALRETEDAYVATVQLVDGKGKAVTTATAPSGQLLQPEELRVSHACCTTGDSVQLGSVCSCNAQWQCSTSHKRTVGLKDPASQVQPAKLQLCWPVATGWTQSYNIPSGSYSTDHRLTFKKADQDNGHVELEIGKAAAWEIWPNDSVWHVRPEPLTLSSLEPYTHKSEPACVLSSAAHYPPGEIPHDKFQALTHPDALRIMVNDIMVMKAVNSPLASLNAACYTVTHATQTSDGSTRNTSLHLLLHPPVLMTKACRPVLPVTVIDVTMCEGACARGDMDQEKFHNLLRQLGFEPGQYAPWNQAMPDACVGLRRLLLRHALACQPTVVQQASLPDGQRIPYYYHSYLSFMQSRHHQHAEITPDDRRPSSSAANTYMKYRFMELLAEIDRCDCRKKKVWLCVDLVQLMRQEGARVLPAEIQSAISLRVRWLLSQIGLQERSPQAGTAKPAGASGTNEVEHSSEAGEQSEGTQLASTSAAATPGADAAACMQCGKQGRKLLKCGKCGAVQYCSRECQVANWKQHKEVCNPRKV